MTHFFFDWWWWQDSTIPCFVGFVVVMLGLDEIIRRHGRRLP